jgi:SRSO17 transposase
MTRSLTKATADEHVRTQIRDLGLHYAVGVDPRTAVWRLDPLTQLPAAKDSVRDIAPFEPHHDQNATSRTAS